MQRGVLTKMKKILNLLVNRETVLYLVFGVLTTIVNFGSYALSDYILGEQFYLLSNIFSFIAATLFAFLTNKQFVFESRVWECRVVLKELGSFFSARIMTFLVVEELGLLIAVQVFGVDRYQIFFLKGAFAAKIVLAFAAVLVNYILSKFLIFKKTEEKRKEF